MGFYFFLPLFFFLLLFVTTRPGRRCPKSLTQATGFVISYYPFNAVYDCSFFFERPLFVSGRALKGVSVVAVWC